MPDECDAAENGDPPAARLSPELYRRLIEAAPVATILVDSAGQILLANARVEELFGYPREELLGKSADRLLPPRFHGLFLPAGEAMIEGLQHAAGPGWELAGLRADGSELAIEIRLSPLTADNRPLQLCMLRDVSRWQQATAELHTRARQEAAIAEFGRRAIHQLDVHELTDLATTQLASTLDVGFGAVWARTDGDGSLMCKALTFAPATSEPDRTKIDPTVPVHLGSFSGYALRSGQPVLYRRSGSAPPFDTTLLDRFGLQSAVAVPLKLRDGIWGVLAAYCADDRDFSIADVHFLEAIASILSVAIERKLAEDSVRRDRDFAESLIQTAQAIVLVVDPQGQIVRFNPYTEELTGFHLEQVRGMDWIGTLLPAAGREAGRAFFQTVAGAGKIASGIHPVVSRAGQQYEIEWSARALVDQSGAVSSVLLIGHDVTELHAAQQQLVESERLAAIGQMASGLAHESRNALQQVGACSEMLAMQLSDNPEALDLVAGVQEAQDRLHRLFDDVRAYATPLRLQRRRARLPDVWRSAWQSVVKHRSASHATLVEKLETARLELAVDTACLEQAFANIFENALDAAGTEGLVTVCCQEIGGSQPGLRILISDNGPGLTPEQRQRIFEPFFTTKTQGTGLGMSIARRAVETHGGQLEVGPASGQGTQLQLILPAERQGDSGTA